MATTKSAGRVSIRVVPDTVGFKNDLQKSLERIERQLKAKIQAELYLDRESLAKLKREIERLVVKIKPHIELDITPEQLAELKAKIERTRPKVNVDLDTAVASRRIAALSRTRTIKLIPIIMDSSLLQNFAKKLQGLAGLNVVRDMFKEGMEFFQNVDRNAIKLGTLFTKFAGIGALIGNAAMNIITMTAQLAAMANIAILAPAFLTGIGISVGILVAALKDAKTVLADLGPTLSKFQDDISADFWREAAGPIRNLVNYLMPILDNPSGTNTARSLGKLVGQIATSFKQLATADKLNTMFDRMNNSIDILTGGVNPFVNAMITLGLTGSKYFERFSTWIVKLTTDFDNFIQKSAENGNLDRWIENAIQGFKDLWNVMQGLVRSFQAINRAAVAAGSADFGDLGVALNHAADVMSSTRFQDTLTRIFRGVNVAVDGILKGIAKIGPALETASPTIFRVFSMIGDIGERVGGMLAGVISNPKFLAGVERFFAGISGGLKNLEPSVKPFGDSLGGILTLMGHILLAVTDLVNSITVNLGPVLDKMGQDFEGLVDPLNKSLQNLVTQTKPVLETFEADVVRPLVSLIKDQLLPLIDKIVTFFGPSVQVIFQKLGDFIRDDLTPLFKKLNEEFDKLNGKGGDFAKWLGSAMDFIGSIGSMDFFKKLMPGFKGNWTGQNGEDGMANFQNDWDNFWRPIIAWWQNEAWPAFEKALLAELQRFEDWGKNEFAPAVLNALGTIWDSVWRRLTGQPQKPLDGAAGGTYDPIGDFFNGIKEKIKTAYENFKIWVQEWIKTWNPFQPIIDYLKDPFGNKGSGGAPRFGDGGSGGKFGPTPTLGSNFFSPDKETSFMDTIVQAVTNSAGKVGPGLLGTIGGIVGTVNPAWGSFFQGLQSVNNTAWPGMAGVAGTNLGIMGTGIDTFTNTSGARFTGFLGGAKSDNQAAWQDMATTTNTNTGNMATDLINFITGQAPKWAGFWQNNSTTVQNEWTDMKGENNSSLGKLATDLLLGLTVAAKMTDVGWKIIKAVGKSAWEQMARDATAGVAAIVAEIAQLGARAASAIGDLSGALYGSGQTLVEGFASGIRSRKADVAAAAAEVAQAVADQMPHSPAKFGPLSGRGYTTYSGRALVKDFAGGMMDNMNLVRKSTAAITGAVQLGANMDLTTDLDANGVVIDRREVNLTVYHPVAEPTSRTIETAANTLRMAKAL